MENTNDSLEALPNEVDFYRKNQIIVEQEIKTLITDNQKLSQQVESLLKENLQFAHQAHYNDKSNEVEELKKQISLITKERDSLHVLWQTSQKTIDALETELEIYQNYKGKQNLNNTKEKRRDLELKVETAVADFLDLESKYKKVVSERYSLEAELKLEQKNVTLYKEKNKKLLEELENTKKDLVQCRVDLSAEKRSYEAVISQLQFCQKECLDKGKREAEAKFKVAEALQLFDLVSTQKNEAHQRIAEITKNCSELQAALANIKRDTEERYRSELAQFRNNYNEKMSDMIQHIQNLDAELVEKGLLLNKTLRENKILQTANENYIREQKDRHDSVDPKLVIADQKLEAVFQELVASERRSIMLLSEKQSLTLDLQQALDNYIRECKRRDWEEGLLKMRCKELKLQMEHLQKSLDEAHDMINKLQAMLSSKSELSDKMVSSKEEEMSELNKHLEHQMELNKKWKESYIDVTTKLKKEIESLIRENKELRVQLLLPASSKESSVDSV